MMNQPLIPSVTEQRKQARMKALRRAELLDDLTAAYEWWLVLVDEIGTATGSARDHVRQELLAKLTAASRSASRDADEARARATEIAASIALGARQTEAS